MRGKILLVVGLGVGYVLGTRAGRGRYEELKAAATRLWSDPRVQRQVNNAEEFVKDKAPEVANYVTDGVKTVASKVTGSKAKTASKPATTATGTPTTPTSTTAK